MPAFSIFGTRNSKSGGSKYLLFSSMWQTWFTSSLSGRRISCIAPASGSGCFARPFAPRNRIPSPSHPCRTIATWVSTSRRRVSGRGNCVRPLTPIWWWSSAVFSRDCASKARSGEGIKIGINMRWRWWSAPEWEWRRMPPFWKIW